MKTALGCIVAFVCGVILSGMVFAAIISSLRSEDQMVIAQLHHDFDAEKTAVQMDNAQIDKARHLLSTYSASVTAAQNTATVYQEQVSSIEKNLADFDSVDTVIYQTVSSPNALQGIGKALTLISAANPALRGFGMLLASMPSDPQQPAPVWVLPGKIRPLFLGGNVQEMQYKWIDAKTGTDESGMLVPAIPQE